MKNSVLIVCVAGIIESKFAWTPPDWTAGVFEQKIEAQDDMNLTLTGSFTISKVVSTDSFRQ
jgi:hypothetical protein